MLHKSLVVYIINYRKLEIFLINNEHANTNSYSDVRSKFKKLALLIKILFYFSLYFGRSRRLKEETLAIPVPVHKLNFLRKLYVKFTNTR